MKSFINLMFFLVVLGIIPAQVRANNNSRLGAGIRVGTYREIGGGSHEYQVDVYADLYLNGLVLSPQSYYVYTWFRDIGNGFALWDVPTNGNSITPDGCHSQSCLNTYQVRVTISGYNLDQNQTATSPDVTLDFINLTVPPPENLTVSQVKDNLSYGSFDRLEEFIIHILSCRSSLFIPRSGHDDRNSARFPRRNNKSC